MSELGYRPATIDDVDLWADVPTAVRPGSPVDPVVTRYWWTRPERTWVIQRFVIDREGRSVGIAWYEHPRWEVTAERFAMVRGELVPLHRRADSLRTILTWMEDRAVQAGARIMRAWANEDDPLRIEAISALGYREDRRGRRWELDLIANRERLLAMTEESRARMHAQGIRLLTLADDADPEKYVKIWRVSEEATQDVPTTLPHVQEPLDDYLDWFRAPNMHEDRFWIARLDDDVVGVSVLSYPPVRGIVGTEWTATGRSVRGRGVARALKCETLAQAIALGVDRVRTGNDAANDPILHINATMGYRSIPGSIEFLKHTEGSEVELPL